MTKRGLLVAVFLIFLVVIGLRFWAPRVLDPSRSTSPSSKAPSKPTPQAPSQAPAMARRPEVARRTTLPDGLAKRESSGDFQVRGFVTNTEGAPLTGVKISLASSCDSDAAWTATSSDTLGFYQIRLERFANVREACLRVERSGFVPVSEWIQPQPDWQKKNFQLTRAGATLRGHVSEPGAGRLEGAQVVIFYHPPYSVYRKIEPNVFRSLTDSTGRYRFQDLPFGSVRVSAHKEGFQFDRLEIELAADEDGFLDFELGRFHHHLLSVVDPDDEIIPHPWMDIPKQGVFSGTEGVIDYQIASGKSGSRVPCRVSALGYRSQVVDLDPFDPVPRVVLRRAAPLRGRIVWEDGSPVAGAQAFLTVASRIGAHQDPPVKTDGSGWFEFYPSDRLAMTLHVRLGDQIESEFNLDPNAPDFVELTMKRPTAGLKGRFLAASGEPYPLFSLTLTRPATGRARNLSFTEPDGSFSLVGLEAGLYRIQLQGFTEDHVEMAVLEDVEIAPGQIAGPIVARGRPVEN